MTDKGSRSSSPQEKQEGVRSLLMKIPLAPNGDETLTTDQTSKEQESSVSIQDDNEKSSTSRSASAKADTSKQSEGHDEFNNDEIQRQMNGVIQRLQSPSSTSAHERTSSDAADPVDAPPASTHTKVTGDDSNSRHGPNSFSLEQTNSVETNSVNEDSFFAKAKTNAEDRPPSSRSKQNGLDETRRFGVVSPKPSGSQVQSPRPSSRASQIDRTTPVERAPSPAKPPNTIVSSESRRESTDKADQPAASAKDDVSVRSDTEQQSTSHKKTESMSSIDRSSLIKVGEQIHIPNDAPDNEQVTSSPPSPVGLQKMVVINPLLGDKSTDSEQDQTAKPSSTSHSRKSSNVSVKSKDKTVPPAETSSNKSRRSSQTSQASQTQNNAKKTPSRKGSNASEQQVSSGKENDVQPVRPASRQSFFEKHDESTSSKSDLRKTSGQQDTLSQREKQQQPDTKSTGSRRSSSIKPVVPVEQKDEKSTGSSVDLQQEQRKSAQKKEAPPVVIDQRRASQQSKTDQKQVETNSTKSQSKQASPRSSSATSDHDDAKSSKAPVIEKSSRATTPTDNEQPKLWAKANDVPSAYSSDDEDASARKDEARPKSPNVDQINARNGIPKTKKIKSTDDQKKKGQSQRSLHRSASAESFNHIPIVDDKSIDSNSGNNTEVERQKRRPIRSKQKDMETNTDSTADETFYLRDRSQKGQQQIKKSPTRKVFKTDKTSSQQDPSTQSRPVTSDVTPRSIQKHATKQTDDEQVNVNVTVLVQNYPDGDEKATPRANKDNDRHTQSDSEQIVTEKQKKRRRPKRISRTTQTYERVFRQMALEEHSELRPSNETEKTVQTRRSQLRPRTRSPKKHLPIYLSTDAFKIEEILPKQFPHANRNISKTSVVARSTSPQGGKLLILRPTLPLHHTDAVNVQRICLQYAIDLMPSETNRTSKSGPLKQLEQSNTLPTIRSPSSASGAAVPLSSNNNKVASNHRIAQKDKAAPYKTDFRPFQRSRPGDGV